MNVALRKPMTQDEFFVWAEAQEGRYEFDGLHPVAMTGGSIDHNQITLNAHVALRSRLRGSCRPLGPDAGVPTIGTTIRYPDALVTCTKNTGTDTRVQGTVVVFEVVSPGTSRVDRFDKVREYHAVSSIRRYIIVESTTTAMTVHFRTAGEPWQIEILTEGDMLRLPDVGIEIPISELYENVSFDSSDNKSSEG